MNIIRNIKSRHISGGLLMAFFTLCTSVCILSSCKEKIDESDLYTFTGEMMTDHFEKNPEVYGDYLAILKLVKPSDKEKASSMYNLLDARGHYTCFAPTNKAIEMYMDSMAQIGQIDQSSLSATKQGDFSTVPDSVLKPIVFNSIIENGQNDAYATTDFEEGALQTTNMNDRYISISYGTKVSGVSESGDTALSTIIYVNTNSVITEADIEVENGYIHQIDRVLSPSNASLADVIMTADNTTFFGELLKMTGIDKKMVKYKDEEWEAANEDILGEYVTPVSRTGRYPSHRYIGYTAFVEPDSVYAANGITDLSSLKEWVRAHAYYDDDTSNGVATSWGNDYESDYNWLNQFVAYHVLPERLTYNNMVTFANEYGIDASGITSRKSTQFYVNVWEYWETIGVQRRSLKITGIRGAKKINRVSVYNTITYREKTGEITQPGITISATNGSNDNNALNGYYYPIDQILIWDESVPHKVLNERMRYDVCSLFPEFMTNNIRLNFTYNETGHADGDIVIPHDYLDNVVSITDGTAFYYFPNKTHSHGSGSWMNYQTDEFNIQGIFDFTMKLPPVPYTGTYELRYGINSNDNRGMAQVYLGKNPNNLPAIGIPLDLRSSSGCVTTATGWVKDVDDDATNAENDKAMRNLGFMKGPKYITLTAGSLQGRDNSLCLRKIIFTGQLEAGQTYYVRFKSVLDGQSYQFFYDYLELVPKSIYAGDEAEDIW